MSKIESLLGPADLYVAGHQIVFSRDKQGRYIAVVEDPRALACLLSVEHYREIADEDEDEGEGKQAPKKRGAARGRAAKGTAEANGAAKPPVKTDDATGDKGDKGEGGEEDEEDEEDEDEGEQGGDGGTTTPAAS
ncbi:hypothetical protein [Microcystis phage Mwe-JY25]